MGEVDLKALDKVSFEIEKWELVLILVNLVLENLLV